MISSFPHALVTLDRSSFSEKHLKNSYRAEFEAGPARQSPIQSASTKVRTVSYVTTTKDDYLEFMDWYKYDINHGNSFFLWQDPVDGEWKRVRFITDDIDAQPLDYKLDNWRLSFQIEETEE